MVRRPPTVLNEAIVDPRDMIREYIVMTAIAAVAIWVAVDAPSVFSIGVAVVAVSFVLVAAAAATPWALRLRLDDDAVTIRAFFVIARRIPWSDVGEIEVAEGWQGETVAVEVGGAVGARTIFGLPIDPTLGRRAFAGCFGLTPADLRDLLVERRDAARRDVAGAAARRSG